MNSIASTITKDKKEKKTSYTFEVNSETFTAHHIVGKKPSLEIFHKDVSIGTVTELIKRSEFVVNQETNPVKITAWMEAQTGFSDYFFAWKRVGTGIGIEVDGKPVHGTLTDPEMNIKKGRSGLWFLVFIFTLKLILNFVADVDFGAIYIIPFILVLVAAIRYNQWTGFAVYTGLILSVLEFVDYILGITGGQQPIWAIIFWIAIRISAFFMILNALKWYRKVKKARLAAAAEVYTSGG